MGYIQFNDARLQKYLDIAVAYPDRKKVVLFGSSRTKYATHFPDDTPFKNSSNALTELNTFRVTKNIAVFEDFRPFLDRILQSKPDVVLMELELMALHRPWGTSRHENLREYLKFVLLGAGRWKVDFDREAALQFHKPCKFHSDVRFDIANVGRIGGRSPNRQIYGLRKKAATESLAEWFTRSAAESGSKVLWLEIPRVSVSSFSTMVNARAKDVFLTKFGASLSVTLARYPSKVPADHFCDSTHMNEAGRNLYTNWLGNLIRHTSR